MVQSSISSLTSTSITGLSQRTLRWPLVFLVCLILVLELFAYAAIRIIVVLYEWCSSSLSQRHRALKHQLANAKSFVQWCQAARELDRAEGRDGWKQNPKSPYYDHELIDSHLQSIRQSRATNDYKSLMKSLMTIYTTNNFSGINNPQLYNQTNFGTKILIQDFIQEVLECSILVRDAADIPLNIRREWFKRVRRGYGQTALLLSGGAGLGFYHLGVLKALFESKCLPSVISGASAGSLMTGFLAVRRDDELQEMFQPSIARIFRACHESWFTRARRWLTKRYLFDVNDWMVRLRRDITKGDTTFAEAYAMTGRTINITITAASKYVPSVILNHKSTPDVLIWSAILASSAMPNIIQPVELLCKDSNGRIRPFHVHGKTWTDGTIKNDIPIKEIATIHNANFFIVSQVNPHLVPFLQFGSRGSTGRPSPRSSGSQYRGGFILSMCERLLKLEMRKWLQLLSELDLLPTIFGTDWRYIFLQSVSGTVTIVPPASVKYYFKMFDDPSERDIAHYIESGEKVTWRKLARISNHYRLERLLNDCKKSLDEQWKVLQARSNSQLQATQQSHSTLIQKISQTSEEDLEENKEDLSGNTSSLSSDEGSREGIIGEPAQFERKASHVQIEAAINAAMMAGKESKGDEQSALTSSPLPQTRLKSSPRQSLASSGVLVPDVVFDDDGGAFLVANEDDSDDDDSMPQSPLRTM